MSEEIKMVKEKSVSTHTIILENNKTLRISGALAVNYYNEHEVALSVSGYRLVVGGLDLTVGKLDIELGIVEVIGTILTIKYSKQGEKTSFIKKLIK